MAEGVRPTLQRWIIVMIALLAPALGGSTQRWSQGVVFVLIAVAIFLRPPQLVPGLSFSIPAIGALALAAVAWLPASAWGETWWRKILGGELRMELPGTFSAQPWLSAEALALLATGLLWLMLLGGHDWSKEERRWMARRVCGGLLLLTICWLVVHYAGWHVPIWVCERNFGPFPNRNQTGDLLATWSVIAAACAIEDFRHKQWSGSLWIVGIAIFLWGLIVNYSRAGVLLFFFGLIGWGTMRLARTRSVRHIAIGFAALLLAGSLFLIFGGSTLERFTKAGSFIPDPMEDYRALVFRDAWQMAVKSPWCGVGLGNFEGLFTLSRDASANHVRLLHPESDWLWLLVEMGWLGPVFALVLAGSFAWRTFPLDRKSAPAVRSAALIGALLFMLHGFFDVSGHRLGSALPGLMLFALAARLPWTMVPSATPAWIARAGAALMGLLGCCWIVASAKESEWPGAIGARVLNERANAANSAEDFTRAIGAADRAIAIAPLDWRNHFIRGVAHAFLEEPEAAELDFLRARRLEPSIASAPYEEGRVWIYFDPARARDAWGEALRREPARNVEYYRKMLADAGDRGGLRQMLRELAENRTALLLEWLGTASSAEFQGELERLRKDGTLEGWTGQQLTAFFSAWLRAGTRAELISAIEGSATWRAAGWRQLATAYAREKNYQRACEVIHQSQPPPILPNLPERGLAEVERAFGKAPRDFVIGYQLYHAQARAGDWAGALATIDKLSALPEAPPYLAWLRADALEHLGRWREAWESLSHTIHP
jgi:O-antigen ligase/tetratricopeptide (TPR) repeat protein